MAFAEANRLTINLYRDKENPWCILEGIVTHDDFIVYDPYIKKVVKLGMRYVDCYTLIASTPLYSQASSIDTQAR